MTKGNSEKQKQKNLVKKLWENKGPRYLEMMHNYIEANFDNEDDKDARRDAHKLLAKIFDSQVPKKIITEHQDDLNYIPARFEQAINAALANAPKMIEVEEGELVDESVALSVRNRSRK